MNCTKVTPMRGLCRLVLRGLAKRESLSLRELPHCVRHFHVRSPRGPCKLFEAHGVAGIPLSQGFGPLAHIPAPPANIPLSGISSRRRRSDIPPRSQIIPLSPGFRRAGGAPTSLPACGGAVQMKTKNQRSSELDADFLFSFAEREGFEPPEPFSSTVFKTAVIDHSTISPRTFRWDVSQTDCKGK